MLMKGWDSPGPRDLPGPHFLSWGLTAHSALLGTVAKSQYGQRTVLWVHPWLKLQLLQLRLSWAQDLGFQAVTPPGVHYAVPGVPRVMRIYSSSYPPPDAALSVALGGQGH